MLSPRLQDHDGFVFFRLVEGPVQGVEHRKRHHIGLAVVDHDGADRAGTGIGREISHGVPPCFYKHPVDTLTDVDPTQGIWVFARCMQASTGCICRAVVACESGRSSIPEMAVIYGEVAAYSGPAAFAEDDRRGGATALLSALLLHVFDVGEGDPLGPLAGIAEIELVLGHEHR